MIPLTMGLLYRLMHDWIQTMILRRYFEWTAFWFYLPRVISAYSGSL